MTITTDIASLAAALSCALAAPSLAAGPSTGMIPLTELPPALYMGFEGGLYPAQSNTPPTAHLAAALAAAQLVRPRNPAGAIDFADGRIVMVAIGMSNTNQGFAPFERQEDISADRNARLIILDTALGGQSADIIANPAASYWNSVNTRIAAAGATNMQVQIAWIKEADAAPTDPFPLHAQSLQSELRAIVQNLHDKFPNLRLAYLSSRTYGGYATGNLNPEPFAYESAFSVKWLIEQQISGDPALNHSPSLGPVRAPLLLWGPYLWADGLTPRAADALVWVRSDFEGDGTHPAPSGEQKVADLLSAFFNSDPTAAAWWAPSLGRALVPIDAEADATVDAAAPNSNFGALPRLDIVPGPTPRMAYLRFDLSHLARPVRSAKLSLRNATSGGGQVFLVADSTWIESALTWNSRPAPELTPLVQVPTSSRDGAFAADVTAALNADPDGILSFALSLPSGAPLSMLSRESAQPPRLILTVPSPVCMGDANGSGFVNFNDITSVLSAWGTIGPAGDANADGEVNFQDITTVLSNWGAICP